MSLRALVPVLLLLCAFSADTVVAGAGAQSFWTQKKQGWFFYDDPAPPTEPAPPPEPAFVPQSEPATPAPTPPPGTFSAEWFRANLPKYKDAAWDNPTVENVRTFMLLQRYAMDRSTLFADATQLAVLGNPYLDETARRPSATFAAHALDKQAGQARSEVLGQIAESIGIFYFYASDCDLCQTQVPVVQMLTHRFTVTPISLDGQDLPGRPFPHFKTDRGHAQLLGVQR